MLLLFCTGGLKLQGNPKEVSNCESSKSSACEFGKVCCQPDKVKTIKKNPMKETDIKKDHFHPIHMVYKDHCISWASGRLYHTKGNSYPSEMFSGGCVFMDHASGYMRINHQVAIRYTEMVKEK